MLPIPTVILMSTVLPPLPRPRPRPRPLRSARPRARDTPPSYASSCTVRRLLCNWKQIIINTARLAQVPANWKREKTHSVAAEPALREILGDTRCSNMSFIFLKHLQLHCFRICRRLLWNFTFGVPALLGCWRARDVTRRGGGAATCWLSCFRH